MDCQSTLTQRSSRRLCTVCKINFLTESTKVKCCACQLSVHAEKCCVLSTSNPVKFTCLICLSTSSLTSAPTQNAPVDPATSSSRKQKRIDSPTSVSTQTSKIPRADIYLSCNPPLVTLLPGKMADFALSEEEKAVLEDPNTSAYDKTVMGYLERNFRGMAALINSTAEDNTRAIGELRAELRAEIAATRTVEDPCEIRFSGLPLVIKLPPADIAKAVLRTIGQEVLIPHLIGVRSWAPPSTTTGRGDNWSFVAKFSSPEVRTQVVRYSARAREQLTADNIFGEGGAARIYASTILPSPNYAIWCAARACYEKYGYDHPVKRGINVFMKKKGSTVLTHIMSLADLQRLAPAPSPTEHVSMVISPTGPGLSPIHP